MSFSPSSDSPYPSYLMMMTTIEPYRSARRFRRDYRTRLKLVSLVCRRRRMLDKLAATNLDSYMKIRDELKIRHIYRIEALKRLGSRA